MNMVENNIGYKQCGRGLFGKTIYIYIHAQEHATNKVLES